jgi:sterol desaturase/sphingolipid hydroxylase (fatty acid hydroxylase superfamily)
MPIPHLIQQNISRFLFHSKAYQNTLISFCTYNIVHYDVHQKYHLNHHFRIQNKGFGITSTLWDHVFGTLPSTKTADKST